MHDFYDASDRDEVERRFAALTATLPTERDLWRSGALDPAVIELMMACGQIDPRLDLLPPAAVPAAVLAACLDIAWWDPIERNRLFKAAVRHAVRLADVMGLRFTNQALGGDLVRAMPGSIAHTVLVLIDVDPPQWLLAGLQLPDGSQQVVGRNAEGPWRAAAQDTLARLREQIDR